jgi:hypothetical protein
LRGFEPHARHPVNFQDVFLGSEQAQHCSSLSSPLAKNDARIDASEAEAV